MTDRKLPRDPPAAPRLAFDADGAATRWAPPEPPAAAPAPATPAAPALLTAVDEAIHWLEDTHAQKGWDDPGARSMLAMLKKARRAVPAPLSGDLGEFEGLAKSYGDARVAMAMDFLRRMEDDGHSERVADALSSLLAWARRVLGVQS